MSSCDREKKTFERSMSNTLISHTNSHTVSGRPTLKDVERFRTMSFRGLQIISEKSEKVLKSKCYEISKANEKTVNTNYEQNDKTMTNDLTTNSQSEAENNYSDCKKSTSKIDLGLDDLKRVAILDEAKDDRQRSNWKTTYSTHVALTVLTVNIVILLFCFIVLNASKIRLDFVYTISIIIVEAIVYLVTSCVWNFMYSVEDLVNSLDEEKVMLRILHGFCSINTLYHFYLYNLSVIHPNTYNLLILHGFCSINTLYHFYLYNLSLKHSNTLFNSAQHVAQVDTRCNKIASNVAHNVD